MLAAILPASGAAREAPPEDVLFAVQAEGGRLIPKGDGHYALTLTGVPRHVVGFSDRPRRDTFNMSAARFFGRFWRRANSLPPAAALDLGDADNDGDAFVVRVRRPRLRGDKLTLDAEVVRAESGDLDHYAHRVDRSPPRRFGAASLFFDTRPEGGGRAESAPRKRTGVDLVFATGAKSGELDRVGKGRYELTLRGLRDHVLAFSDHPVDLSYNVRSGTFFKRWWRNLFADSSPNGALDFVARSGRGEAVALELSNPRLKDETTLSLDARPLRQPSGGLGHYRGRTLDALPRRFKELSLFVDPSIGSPPNSSDCRFIIRNRTMRIALIRAEVEGTDFTWRTPSGYGVPSEGIPPARTEYGQVTQEASAKWEGEAKQRPFGSFDHCAAKLFLGVELYGSGYTLKVTDYMLANERHLPTSIECVSQLQYWKCEKSVGADYYHECWYPTGGYTEEAYCVDEWITTGYFTLCDEAPAFPIRHTCPGWVPPKPPPEEPW